MCLVFGRKREQKEMIYIVVNVESRLEKEEGEGEESKSRRWIQMSPDSCSKRSNRGARYDNKACHYFLGGEVGFVFLACKCQLIEGGGR